MLRIFGIPNRKELCSDWTSSSCQISGISGMLDATRIAFALEQQQFLQAFGSQASPMPKESRSIGNSSVIKVNRRKYGNAQVPFYVITTEGILNVRYLKSWVLSWWFSALKGNIALCNLQPCVMCMFFHDEPRVCCGKHQTAKFWLARDWGTRLRGWILKLIQDFFSIPVY